MYNIIISFKFSLVSLILFLTHKSFQSISKPYVQIPLHEEKYIYYYLSDTNAYLNLTVGLQKPYSSFPKDNLPPEHLELINNDSNIFLYRNGHFQTLSHSIINSPLHFKDSESNFFIGFARKCNEQNYSIINNFHTDNLINYKSFAIELHQDKDNNLYIGNSLPSHLKRGKYKIELDTRNDISGWTFKLNALFANGKRLKRELTVRMALDHETTIVDKETYEFIRENIFKTYLNNGGCKETVWSSNSGTSLSCDETIIKQLPKLYMEVNNYKKRIHIPIDYRNAGKSLNIAYNKVVDGDDVIWILRSSFYDKLIEFDNERDKIIFYLNEDDNISKSIQIYLIIFLCYFIVISLGYLLWNTRSFWGRKKHENVNINF